MNALQNITAALGIFWRSVRRRNEHIRISASERQTVDAQGHPVAGAVIQQYGYRQSLVNRFEWEVRQQATSDANGSFELQISRASALPQAPCS